MATTYQPRDYFLNGKAIILDKYQDVENAKNDQDMDAVNSMGSGVYQSSVGRNFNQTDNQFQESNRFNNQPKIPISSNTNNYINQSGELNTLYSPNSNNLNSPTQMFDTNNNNTFTQKNFYRTDNQNYINQNPNDMNSVGRRTNYNMGYYPNNQNMNSQTQNGMTMEMKKYLEKLVENLYDYYYSTKGFFQNDPKVLYEFYWEYRKRYLKGIRVTEKIRELMNFNEEDVERCIYEHINNIRNRIRSSSTFYGSTTANSKIKKSSSLSKPGENNINNRPNYTFTKDTLRRLYPKQEEMERRERQKLNCDNFNSFFQKLLNQYQKENGKLTNDKDELIQFWRDLPNKERKGLQWENGEKDLIEEMDLFFNDEELIKSLSDQFYRHTKFRTYHPTPLHNFWEFDLTENDRYYLGLNKYNKDDTYLLLNKYYEQIKEEEKEKNEKLENEKREKEEKERMEKRREILEKKEEREKRINELAESKDRYKTGRVMVNLQKKFQYDNIIKKMIKNEFKDNKLFKFPEEYAVRDEDEQKDILFKHDLEKGEIAKTNEEKIKKQIQEAYDDYNYEKDKKKPYKEKRIEEKKQLFNFIKDKAKEYYKKMVKRLENDNDKDKIESINIFLNNMYKEMSKKHRNATRLYFKRPRCEVLKKTYKYKKNHTFYPRKLKYFFFRLLRRIGVDQKGKLVFAKTDNLPFWSPSLSNNCKIHGNNCPIYCCYNTHNEMIKELRDKNFNSNFNIKQCKKKLIEKETLNLWKRPDIKKEKEKIFMCFDDAEHCTFEPKLIQNGPDQEKDEIINSRLNNMKWVNEMGKNFTIRRGTIYKEGVLKRAKIFFNDGRYKDTIKELKKAFDLEAIKIFKKNGEYKPKQKDKDNNYNKPRNIFDRKKDENEPTEDFKNEKNLQLINEVYFMLKTIEEFRRRQKSQTNKLKDEIELIEYNKKKYYNKNVDSKEVNCDEKFSKKNPQFTFVQGKYFNCKKEMCTLKDKCPNLNPKSKEPCPYAHQISELKFPQQMNENIKLRKNLLSTLSKGQEPNIKVEWVPTGPLESCIGCGMTFNDVKREHNIEVAKGAKSAGKGICGFCQYNKRNNKQIEKNNKATKKKNEKILKKIGYKGFQIDQH